MLESSKLDIGKVTQAKDVTQAGFAADARQLNAAIGGMLANKVASTQADVGNLANRIQTKENEGYFALGWGEASHAPAVTEAYTQWNRVGLTAFVYFALRLNIESAYADYPIIRNVPKAMFGYTPFGIAQCESTGMAYEVQVDQEGEIILKSGGHPFTGLLVRGSIVYPCQN